MRSAYRAGSFYPSDPAALEQQFDACLSRIRPGPESGLVLGGIVPHAGWVYSGPTAATTFAALGPPAPRTVVIFGAVHVAGVRVATLSPDDAWETPLGPVAVDRELAGEVMAAAGRAIREDASAHRREHSIEVQLPFVRAICPGARILPVAVPPDPASIGVGATVGRVLAARPERIVVIGSTDLTHYGPNYYGFAPAGLGPTAHRWAKEENDRAFLDRVVALDAEGALKSALERRNACGAGAAAAAISAVIELGATHARLLDHTTSHEARADEPTPTDFVGYASVVFLK